VVIVKPLGRVPVWPSGLVTETLRVPVAAVEPMAMLAVSCVAEFKEQEFTVMPAPKLHEAPLWKALPVMITLERFCPWVPELGLTEVTEGGVAGVPTVMVMPGPGTSRLPLSSTARLRMLTVALLLNVVV